MDHVTILLLFDALLLAAAGYFTLESFREKEPQAPRVGLCVCGLLAGLGLAAVALPPAKAFIGAFFGLAVFSGLLFLIPSAPNRKALQGGRGYAVDEVARFDERDVVFARNRSLPPGSEVYRCYYKEHPEREVKDAERRQKGGTVGRVGAIDDGYRPNVAMIGACFDMPPLFGQLAEASPTAGSLPEKVDPARAAMIVKGFARRIGADLVGICRVNPAWAYSRRGEIFYGNWDDWGRELPEPLPFAVVVATEMDRGNVCAGPHTPALFESSCNYGKGAFITTILSRWFAAMGYRAVAQHSRHYDFNMVPLAIDAGLGELGRLGYLISDGFGPRVRLFAVTTDMPLAPDLPVDLGVEGFCRRCFKCADSCPSRSIPAGEKIVVNGVEKWKLNEETCFDYWAKVGTDCSICMGVCPFSRPNRGIHRLARRVIRRSRLAQTVFPAIDNLIYGKRWKPRPVAEWLDYSGRNQS
jgi:reductive dehalogenase